MRITPAESAAAGRPSVVHPSHAGPPTYLMRVTPAESAAAGRPSVVNPSHVSVEPGVSARGQRSRREPATMSYTWEGAVEGRGRYV